MPLSYQAKQKRRGEDAKSRMGNLTTKNMRSAKDKDFSPSKTSGVQIRKALQSIGIYRKTLQNKIREANTKLPDFEFKRIQTNYYAPAGALINRAEKTLQDPKAISNVEDAMSSYRQDTTKALEYITDGVKAVTTSVESSNKSKKTAGGVKSTDDLTEKQRRKANIRRSFGR